MPAYLLSHEEIKELAEENQVPEGEICGACGQVVRVQIFKGSGWCSDNHRKVINGDDPSAYPFEGNPSTGAT